MLKKTFTILSFLIIFIFLIGCTERMGGEKINLTDKEGNIVGEAFKLSKNMYEVSPKFTSQKDIEQKLFSGRKLNFIGNLAPWPTKSSLPYLTLKNLGIVDSASADLKSFYLQEGPQTKITSLIREKANLIQAGSTDRETVNNILYWENRYFKADSRRCGEFGVNIDSDEIKRTRTAHEVLYTQCPTGCTDFALVFVALARAKGIPATITETIDERWVAEMVWGNHFNNQKSGHFFSEVYLSDEEKWEVVDPTAANWTVKDQQGYILRRDPGEKLGTGIRELLFERGLDSRDYGVETMQEFGESVKKRYYVEQGDQP